MKLVKAHTDTDTDLLLSVNMSEGTRDCPIGLHSKAPPQLTVRAPWTTVPCCNTYIGPARKVSLGAECIYI